MNKIAVIGAGFSGLASACCLAKNGLNVTVFEKNAEGGGRARKFEANGFVFDMGPSWYWMPEVFENFFRLFGRHPRDYYELVRLAPSYRVYFGKGNHIDVPAGIDPLRELFEKLEPGSGGRLTQFLAEAKAKYALGVDRMMSRPGLSLREVIDRRVLLGVVKHDVFRSMSSHIRKFFKHPWIVSLLEFPVLFLGAPPARTPALYSLMNYADMALGTWYPLGGMNRVVQAMQTLVLQLGVTIHYGSAVGQIECQEDKVTGLWSNGRFHRFDMVVASADYNHVEQQLIPERYRSYSREYWDSRTMAPSCLIFYLGIDKKIKHLLHHTLFFDTDLSLHASEIYDNPRWPSAPQFYVSCPSKTDPTVAPAGCENLMILIPVASGLDDHATSREKYFDNIISRLETLTGESIREHVIYKRSYAHNDFVADYNAFRGNAYGLANTLGQTANLKPSIRSRKVRNLFYAGQLTVPGPGVPPAIISGQLVAREIIKQLKKLKHAEV